MNTYAKYCPNVWVAKCTEPHQRGEIIPVQNKYGTDADCEVHNCVLERGGFFYYSVTRCDGLNRQTYAEKKAEKYQTWAASAAKQSAASWEASNEGREFLSLGEPIKVGHHSEGRHRALIERNHARMGKSIELDKKAESHAYKSQYWESQAGRIDLSMPESIEYFTHELEKLEKHHAGLKDGTIPRAHSMSLAYSSKAVKDTKTKLVTAHKLWGTV